MSIKSSLFAAILGYAFALNASDLDSLPAPYNTVNILPFNPHGWYGNAHHIEELVQRFNIKTIVEVGSWMGASTRHMATIIPEDGIVYAVDTWKGTPGERYKPEILVTLYDQFLSNVIHSNLTNKIVPVRMESLEAAEALDVHPDMVYIDATHQYAEVYADLTAWYPHVKHHGIITGDDWGLSQGAVGRAVTDFANENNLIIHTNGHFWWLEER